MCCIIFAPANKRPTLETLLKVELDHRDGAGVFWFNVRHGRRKKTARLI